MVLLVDIAVTDEAWTVLLPEANAWAEEIVRQTLIAAGTDLQAEQDFEVSLLLSGDAAVRDLNHRFRGKDKPTNVLSFPAPALPESVDAPRILGDIAFALETVRREADESGKPVMNHLTHLLVHGVLHLVGYTHETDEDADEMMAIEIEVLAARGICDPYRDVSQEVSAA